MNELIQPTDLSFTPPKNVLIGRELVTNHGAKHLFDTLLPTLPTFYCPPAFFHSLLYATAHINSIEEAYFTRPFPAFAVVVDPHAYDSGWRVAETHPKDDIIYPEIMAHRPRGFIVIPNLNYTPDGSFAYDFNDVTASDIQADHFFVVEQRDFYFSDKKYITRFVSVGRFNLQERVAEMVEDDIADTCYHSRPEFKDDAMDIILESVAAAANFCISLNHRKVLTPSLEDETPITRQQQRHFIRTYGIPPPERYRISIPPEIPYERILSDVANKVRGMVNFRQEVRGHVRHLRSGRIVPVRPCERYKDLPARPGRNLYDAWRLNHNNA